MPLHPFRPIADKLTCSAWSADFWTRMPAEKYGLSKDFRSANAGYGTLPEPKQTEFVVKQIDYIAKRIGWEHVGVGSDFDHGAGIIGFDSAVDVRNVTE